MRAIHANRRAVKLNLIGGELGNFWWFQEPRAALLAAGGRRNGLPHHRAASFAFFAEAEDGGLTPHFLLPALSLRRSSPPVAPKTP